MNPQIALQIPLIVLSASILLFFTKGGRRLLIGLFCLLILPLTFLFGLALGTSNDASASDSVVPDGSLGNQVDRVEAWFQDTWFFQFFDALGDVLEDIGDAIGLDFDGDDGDGGDGD